jgi:hypothetical protein
MPRWSYKIFGTSGLGTVGTTRLAAGMSDVLAPVAFVVVEDVVGLLIVFVCVWYGAEVDVDV